MQDLTTFLERYRIWNYHLEKVCQDIGTASMQYKPVPESNSAAWILVHLLNQYKDFLNICDRSEVRAAMDELPSFTEKTLLDFPFSSIFTLAQEYRLIFLKEVKRLEKENLIDTIVPAGEDKTWMDLVFAVINHEIYHCGQLAYIARIIQQKASTDSKWDTTES